MSFFSIVLFTFSFPSPLPICPHKCHLSTHTPCTKYEKWVSIPYITACLETFRWFRIKSSKIKKIHQLPVCFLCNKAIHTQAVLIMPRCRHLFQKGPLSSTAVAQSSSCYPSNECASEELEKKRSRFQLQPRFQPCDPEQVISPLLSLAGFPWVRKVEAAFHNLWVFL